MEESRWRKTKAHFETCDKETKRRVQDCLCWFHMRRPVPPPMMPYRYNEKTKIRRQRKSEETAELSWTQGQKGVPPRCISRTRSNAKPSTTTRVGDWTSTAWTMCGDSVVPAPSKGDRAASSLAAR